MIKKMFDLAALSALLLSAADASLYAVDVIRVNADTVPLYEMFETVLDLGGVSYDNPYDPREVDVNARFVSPTGAEWRINGFYDNYLGRDEWKVRFSPNEIGEWSYIVTLNSPGASSTSEVQTFDAVASEHHGWLRVSHKNPHYLAYDDGASFYGVGAYTPWRNSVQRFDNLAAHGGNLFGIWNITYGGMVNEAGLIEEELGRYNQEKCGRIDSLLAVSEARDLHCMLAVWPHDLFSQTVWAHQWHQNPYSQLCDVVDVYSDSICWDYQKQQYRYLIARFAHSRAFGIWEIINEINGTDGWAAGRQKEAGAWVHKVHNYFKENDPYDHPTTASRSGGYGEYWGQAYTTFDLPNLHVYESQGWPQDYAGDPLRSSIKNYAFAAKRFWDNFEQPGIFGEAGWKSVYVEPYTPEYSAHYHNALWTCLANGLAATPIWWTWDDPLRAQDWDQMKHLAKFIRKIDFVGDSKIHFEESNDDFDLFGMKSDTSAFGWVRAAKKQDISGYALTINGDFDVDIPVWAIHYFDAWRGEWSAVHIRPNVNGKLYDRLPTPAEPHPDMAFIARPAEGGDTPATLQLWGKSQTTFNIDSLRVPIACFLFDEQDQFCPQASNTLTFTLSGPGALSATTVQANSGMAAIDFLPGEDIGRSLIIATSPGLTPDSVTIDIKDRALLDDFESYGDDESLHETWQTKSGTVADVFLDDIVKSSGAFGMRMEYGIGEGYKRYARIERVISQNYSGGHYLTFWLKPDASNRDLEIRIRDANKKYWRTTIELAGEEARIVAIPLESFTSTGGGVLDLSAMQVITLTVNRGAGQDGAGTIWFDDLFFPATPPANVAAGGTSRPRQINLAQNYPNPFNPNTTILYELPKEARLTLAVFNVRGEQLLVLADGRQQAGQHRIEWDASALPSGLYFYKLSTGDDLAMKKCLLVK